MVEKIYDTIRAIIYSEFPKNKLDKPFVYDRTIDNWFFGDVKLLPSPLGVIMKGASSNVKDIGFGLRQIDYSINVQFYSSNDDQETTERVLQEASRIAHSILKNHRTMWICDLCPFCGKLPLSPIHYVDLGTITDVKVGSTNSGGIVAIPGSIGSAIINVTKGLSGIYYNKAELLSGGLGISTNSYLNNNISLTFSLSGGSGHGFAVTSVMSTYLTAVKNGVNTYWQELHDSTSPPYYDWPGLAYQAVTSFMSDYKQGFLNSTNTSVFSTISSYHTILDSCSSNNVELVRLLQDIQISDIKPSDDAVDAMFLRSGEFTLKGKEIFSVDTFGPNNVNVNAI